MDCKNTALDDISAVIGYTPTTVLAGMFGGRIVYVPLQVLEGHYLYRLIGERSFVRLVREFGGQDLFIPTSAVHTRYTRWRVVRDMLLAGKSVRDVCDETGFTPKHVHNIRRYLEELTLLPLILTKPTKC